MIWDWVYSGLPGCLVTSCYWTSCCFQLVFTPCIQRLFTFSCCPTSKFCASSAWLYICWRIFFTSVSLIILRVHGPYSFGLLTGFLVHFCWWFSHSFICLTSLIFGSMIYMLLSVLEEEMVDKSVFWRLFKALQSVKTVNGSPPHI